VFFITCARAGTLAQIQTGLGEIDVELFDQDKPITVNNFIQLAQAGAFVNSFFHRCEPGFVVQGGGYFAFNPFLSNIIAPPYANLGQVGNFGNIPNEFGVGRRFSNVFGTISMAKVAGDTNSANSQFFFNLANNTFLDATDSNNMFVVFGHVVRGTNILNLFNGISKGNNLVNLQDTYGTNGLFTELPTYSLGTNPPPYSNLVYFSVNILSTQVAINKTNGARRISWTSVNGVTNNVEFATNLPPVWQVLMSTNGNGGAMSYTDTTTNSVRRFYRIHVLF
jgi:cyclophilin family peptidyl-prolyl cis-trans isomerase